MLMMAPAGSGLTGRPEVILLASAMPQARASQPGSPRTGEKRQLLKPLGQPALYCSAQE